MVHTKVDIRRGLTPKGGSIGIRGRRADRAGRSGCGPGTHASAIVTSGTTANTTMCSPRTRIPATVNCVVNAVGKSNWLVVPGQQQFQQDDELRHAERGDEQDDTRRVEELVAPR